MAVPAGPTEKRYTGNGVTTIFTIPFLLIAASDLDVFIDGVEVVSGFTITGTGNPTSTITFTVPPANLSGILLTLNVPFERLNDYQENGDFLASTVNRDFDRIWQALKQLLRVSGRALTLGVFDVDGAGAYRAKGNRISDLADPVAAQDAVTYGWVRTYLTSIIGAITGPINNALNIFFKGPDNLNYVVQDLSSTTDAAKGGSLIGWFQAGAGAIARTVTSKLREWVSIGDYGGTDDNSTDNTTALNNAKNFVGYSGVLRLVRRNTGIFKFTNIFNLNGAVIKNDPDVTISATESLLNIVGTSPARVMNRLRLYFANINFQYFLYPEHSEDLAEKRVWLDESDYDLSYRENFDLTTLASMRHETLLWPASDTWATASNVGVGLTGGIWPYINWGSGAASTWHRSSFPVREGDDVCASFSTGGVYNRAVFVQHATGYIALYATGVSGGLQYVQKTTGNPTPVTNAVGVGDIFTSQIQYYGENSVWRIKILNKRQFLILLNGQQVGGVLAAPSDIMRAGFGYMPQAVTSVSISGFVRTRNNRAGGRQPETITIYGDSMSADMHGGWPYFMRKALEGSAGVVVGSITNLAVPGYTSGNAYTDMQAYGFNGGTALICAGTNDIQGLLGPTTLMTNILNMIVYARNHSQTPIVWIPPLWYTQAEAQAAGAPAGTGQGSANAYAGADYRVNVERICAASGVKCVDMTQVTGPINAAYLVPGAGVIADSGMRDNIHPTAYMYKKLGLAMAKAILGERSGGIKRRREIQALPITYASGWSAYPSAPEVAQMLLSEDGTLQLLGKISSPTGTVSNGTVVGTLREDLRPLVPYSGPASWSGGNCKVYVDLNGDIRVDNFGPSGTYLDISTITIITGA